MVKGGFRPALFNNVKMKKATFKTMLMLLTLTLPIL